MAIAKLFCTGFPAASFAKQNLAKVHNVNLGGDERDRTDDPLLAKQVLSQLSYTPIFTFEYMAYLAVLAHILLRFLFTGPSKLNNDCKNELRN